MDNLRECYCIHDTEKRKHRPDLLTFSKAEAHHLKSDKDIVITFIEKSAYARLEKQNEILRKALFWYAGESQWKEKSEWKRDAKFLTFDKFGSLDADLADGYIAKKALSDAEGVE